MTSQSRVVRHSEGEDGAQYGIARARNQAFNAVIRLWRKRSQAGMTQAEFARKLGRDTGWLSTKLKGPSNWTLKTFGRMAEALDGDIEILVHDLHDPPAQRDNFDAYAALADDGPSGQRSSPEVNGIDPNANKQMGTLAYAE
jgi:transcriptional regulator with XRE-family HTH domain